MAASEHSSSDRVALLRQSMAVISASIGALGAGSVLGYSSPALYQLRQVAIESSGTFNNHTAISFRYGLPYELDYLPLKQDASDVVYLSSVEIAWFSASYGIGALLGGVSSSPLQNYLGRRLSMMASVIPAILGWILLGFGSSFPVLIVGRILSSIFNGINCVVVNTYIGEVASSKIRGMLGCSFEVMFSLGTLLSFIVGSVLPWRALALIHCLPPATFLVLMSCTKESPSYFISKGRLEKAMDSLQYFRGPDCDVTSELERMKNFHEEVKKEPFSWRLLKKSYVIKPLIISLTILNLNQFSGINAISFNISTIFKRTRLDFSDHVSSEICVTFQLLAALASVATIEKLGRKPLLVGSYSVMAAMLGCLGLYFQLLEKTPVWTEETLQWLPLLALTVYLMAFAAGCGSIGWILIGEMFPPNVSESAGALVIVTVNSSIFVVLFSFDMLQSVLHSSGYYWLCGMFCVIGALFSALVFKETRGKTLEEISFMYGGPSSLNLNHNASRDDVHYGSVNDGRSKASKPRSFL